MKQWSRKRKIIFGSALLCLAIQTLQPRTNENKSVQNQCITNAMAVPDSVLTVLKTACYDCHSNNTKYPWYSRIVPLNWWISFHVEEGKQEVNFDNFNSYTERRRAETLEAIAETVKTGSMPLSSYLVMHKDARLTREQRKQIVAWATGAKQKHCN